MQRDLKRSVIRDFGPDRNQCYMYTYKYIISIYPVHKISELWWVLEHKLSWFWIHTYSTVQYNLSISLAIPTPHPHIIPAIWTLMCGIRSSIDQSRSHPLHKDIRSLRLPLHELNEMAWARTNLTIHARRSNEKRKTMGVNEALLEDPLLHVHINTGESRLIDR